MREYKIGEVFEHKGVSLEVIKEPRGGLDCDECYFDGDCLEDKGSNAYCSWRTRTDKKNIIYREAKEDKVKPIFENEEELTTFLVEICSGWSIRGSEKRVVVYDINREQALKNAKEKGYIKQSSLEDAREKYLNAKYFAENGMCGDIKDVESYIKELEKALETKDE